jgi:hypothetical protein
MSVNPAPRVYTHGFGAIPFGNILPFIPVSTDGAFWWCGVKLPKGIIAKNDFR